MTNKEKKDIAKALFIESSMNQKEIAVQVGCAHKTLYNWMQKGNWEEQKEMQTITRPELLKQSYRQLRAINQKIETDFDGVPDKQLSDAKGVVRKEIEALSNSPIHKQIEVIVEIEEWLKENHPKDFIKTKRFFVEFMENRMNEEF